MKEEQQLNIFERLNKWIKESIMVKLVSIGFLILILLIPTSWIQSLIEERQNRMSEATSEIAAKWSDNQTISGPILVVPYTHYSNYEKDGVTLVNQTVKKAFFLPQNLEISSVLEPKKLSRGIFDVVVYNAQVSMKGDFPKPDLASLNILEENVLWKDAYLLMGITDLRGIKNDPKINFGGRSYFSEPSQDDLDLFQNSISVRLKLQDAISVGEKFALNLSIKGSEQLFFIPTGKNTKVDVTGQWKDPSFGGSFLPDKRSISDSVFTASWSLLHFNRPFPQQWKGNTPNIHKASFGVDLLLPVDQYQKSIRSAKYSVLIIMLTFIALFLIEIICKVRIHPFQYILIGSALIIYYTLQLSISEHIGYNLAYTISAFLTVMLIGAYSISFLPNRKIVSLLILLLSMFYTFIFTITQLQDYALLLGSIGLFVIIGVLMFVSRKINWYGDEEEEQLNFQ